MHVFFFDNPTGCLETLSCNVPFIPMRLHVCALSLQIGEDSTQYFYVVVAVFPSGLTSSCSSMSVSSPPFSTESSAVNSKNVTLELLESLSELVYAMGVIVPTVVYTCSYIVAFIWIVVFDWIRLEYSLLLRGCVVNLLFQCKYFKSSV